MSNERYTITVQVKKVTGKEPPTGTAYRDRSIRDRAVHTGDDTRVPTRDVEDVANFTVRGETIDKAIMRAKASLDVVIMEEGE